MAGRRAFVLYGHVCAVKPDEDRAFWQDGELILKPSVWPQVPHWLSRVCIFFRRCVRSLLYDCMHHAF